MGSSSTGDTHPERPAATRIVGLGASAGGLEALEQFLAHVPLASGLAYVVVQHLDPTHKAMLVELLRRATALPVYEATEAVRARPDTVYVIPPNSQLAITNGVLHLGRPAEPRGLRLPIDVFFTSLASDLGEQAIGVVLSGMGSDGTLGLKAIRSRGGLCVVQLPGSAQFDSMPKSAIAADCAQIVALPAEMPERIQRVLESHDAGTTAPIDRVGGTPPMKSAIVDLLRERGDHDLSLYKASTLRRRVERRMGVHGLKTVEEYEQLLRENQQELDLLFKEMLIGVTSFFRDPEVWQQLKNTVLPAIFAGCGAHMRFRGWVVGCSTGEEAYSLAIVFKEAMEALPAKAAHTLQIYASDLNEDAIAKARRGHYPAHIAADVDPGRLARFFSAEGGGFLIDKSIRDTVLFAQHNVVADPPFTRLDFLLCRNLIIYFTAPLQRRLLPLFHYCLKPGGVLILGKAETVGRWQANFTSLDQKSRIYRRPEGSTELGAVDFPSHRTSLRSSARELPVPPSSAHRTSLQSLADQVLLQEFSPPALLVNEGGDIIYISGRTGRYLEPAAGKANWNVHVMLRPEIRVRVAAAMRQALAEKKPVELSGLTLDGDATHRLDMTIRAIHEPEALKGLVMIVFRDVVRPPSGSARRKRGAAAVDPAIRDEVAGLQEELQSLRLEMGASREELQATNEELQSTNEELQSANEELTTSKEEAQSMNEELQTINTQLQAKLDELSLAQSDMQNLLNSTDIATLFLDNSLNVRRFTDKITRIIHLREADVGRPLSDLASTLVYPQLIDDANETLRTLAFSEKEISSTDGHWYSVRIMPYRTLANVIQGVVMTFVNITAAKELESRLRKG